ncbi:hypothetical protein Sfum_2327 [Syntrophobacter fumaroxidans MPOB]|uniref:Uncharacterized protein n=1 Tax=Syntrophobacter fumaroxidans (strain DSM 10017 / MPOB) TaxID=335543 RepID=A0LKQ6_SYNFM|nr:hypothetical protein Sfum_2327 [Syntrophobacter fumaroxidans MPOB]
MRRKERICRPGVRAARAGRSALPDRRYNERRPFCRPRRQGRSAFAPVFLESFTKQGKSGMEPGPTMPITGAGTDGTGAFRALKDISRRQGDCAETFGSTLRETLHARKSTRFHVMLFAR